jgi:hypothetical protein
MAGGQAGSDDVLMNPRTGLIGQVAAPLAGTRHLGDTHGTRRSRGQVVVETAIVMPVFVFLILGLLQLGLMHHARVMSKYASYKAVRAGAVNRGEVDVMEKAALAVLLPVLGRDSTTGAPYKTDSPGAYDTAWNGMKSNLQGGGIKFVEVIVCNPKRSQIAQNANFDDARQAMGQRPGATPEPPDPNDPPPAGAPPPPPPGVGTSPNLGWQGFNSSKLQIQVTVFYRMYIPFANWMVWRLAVGEETGSPKKQRWLGWKKDPNSPEAKTLKNRLMSLANSKKYIMPIRASYAMRMQSNFSTRAQQALPNGGGAGTNTGKNDSQCRIPWATQ